MSRRREPIERAANKAKGDGLTPGGRQLAVRGQTATRSVAPIAPRGLHYRGQTEWHKVWTAGFWLKPDQDYAWVEQIARAYDDMERFRKRVEEDGLVQRGSLGQPVAHPLIAEIRKCEDTIRKCLSTLGFSPTDRARLGIAEAKAQTMIQDLINSGRK
jgi:P27 family predicted phage terminase small subunit